MSIETPTEKPLTPETQSLLNNWCENELTNQFNTQRNILENNNLILRGAVEEDFKGVKMKRTRLGIYN